MTILLQTAETPLEPGIFHSPLFLGLSGAIHVLRAVDQLRAAASAAAEPRTTGSHGKSEDASLSSPQRYLNQRQCQRQPQGMSRSSDDAPQQPAPGAPTNPPLLPPPPYKTTETSASAPWDLELHDNDDFDSHDASASSAPGPRAEPVRGSSAAPAPAPAATSADALPAASGGGGFMHPGTAHPHPHSRLECGWEELAALHASTLAGHAVAAAANAAAASATVAASWSAEARLPSGPSADPFAAPEERLWRPRSGPPCGPAASSGYQLQHHHYRRRYRLPAAHQEPLPYDGLQVRHRQQNQVAFGPPPLGEPDYAGGGGGVAATAARLRGPVLPAFAQQVPMPMAPLVLLLTQRRQGIWRMGRKTDEERTVAAGVAAAREAGADAGSPPQWLQVATTLAGAVSRTAAQIAIHPLDTLKTRMQVRMPTPQLQVWRAIMSCAATRPRAVAAWAGAAGARDLLLGLGSAVAGVLPASALYFTAEPWLRARLGEALSADGESPVCRLTASAAAATLSALIRVPADVVKHRVQAYAYPCTARAAQSILATKGPAGLYAGFGATLLRDAPEIVIQFAVYRKLKELLEQRRRRRSCSGGDGSGAAAGGASTAEHLFLGGAAGAAAALATTPLDVIKTQLQCGAAASVPAAAGQVLRAGGPAALFGGLAPRLLQTGLCSALFFMCFEASKARLKDLAASTAAAAPPPPAHGVTAEAPPIPPPQAGASTALKSPPQGWRLPLLLPPRQRQRPRGLRSRCHGSGGGGTAAAAAAVMGPWENVLWDSGGTLAPVALYAYAYAGAAAPAVTASAAAAATDASPRALQS